MLTLTPDASAIVNDILAPLPEGTGLRISTVGEEAANEAPAFTLELCNGPAPDDAIVEGGQVFVSDDAAPELEDKVLDATMAEEGVQFSLRQQDVC
jgi:iron-sulfur cluster assembly protein